MHSTAQNKRSMVFERYELAIGRIAQIPDEQGLVAPAFEDYFRMMAGWILKLDKARKQCREEAAVVSYAAPDDVQAASYTEPNEAPAASHAASDDASAASYTAPDDAPVDRSGLIQSMFEENYGNSYLNPEYATQWLGEKFGPLMSALAAGLLRMADFVFAREYERALIRAELYLEIYFAFITAEREHRETASEGTSKPEIPRYYYIQRKIWQCLFDYAEDEAEADIRETLNGKPVKTALPNPQFAADHWEDIALFADDVLMSRLLEALQNVVRRLQSDEMHLPKSVIKDICTTSFGDQALGKEDLPEACAHAPRLTPHQKRLMERFRRDVIRLQ